MAIRVADTLRVIALSHTVRLVHYRNPGKRGPDSQSRPVLILQLCFIVRAYRLNNNALWIPIVTLPVMYVCYPGSILHKY